MNVQIMLLRLAPLVWSLITTSLPVGRIILLIPSLALPSAKILVMSWDIRTDMVLTFQHHNRS